MRIQINTEIRLLKTNLNISDQLKEGTTLSCKIDARNGLSIYPKRNTKNITEYLELVRSSGTIKLIKKNTKRTVPKTSILKPSGRCKVTSSASPVNITINEESLKSILPQILIITNRATEKAKSERNICSKKTTKKTAIIPKSTPIILIYSNKYS